MNKEYKLLQAFNIGDIEYQINEYASKGWEINGSLSTQVINGKPVYTQVMVREKRDINESNPDNGKQLLHG
jgi:hypothetical protein